MRSGIVISGAAHVAFMLALVLGMSGPRPFASPVEDALVVEVMTPEDMAAESAARTPAENADKMVPAEPGTAEIGTAEAETPSVPNATQVAPRPSPAAPIPSSSENVPRESGDFPTQAPPEAMRARPAAASTHAPARTTSGEAEPAQTEPAHAEPNPPESHEAESAEPAPPQDAAFASAETQDEEPQFGMTDLVRLYTLRLPGFDAQASATAQLTQEEVGVFRQNLRKCWRQPSGVAADSRTRVVMRVALRPDGGLAGEPTLIEATASPEGPAVYQAALRALQQCQPHRSLPRERYDEWRLLDIGFSPREMAGG